MVIVEFVRLEGRRFVTVDVDLTLPLMVPVDEAVLDETDQIASVIAEQLPLDGAIIRIRYRASEEQHRRVDRKALVGFCEEAGAHVYQVAPDIIRPHRARADHVDETLDPLAAVGAWCVANELTFEVRDGLQRLTAGLLAEVPA